MKLQELLGEELYAQVKAKLDEVNAKETDQEKHVRYEDLSEGNYISKVKYDDIASQLAGKDAELTTANDLITEVNVYFPDENATGLFPERKSVKATDKSKYKAAMEALMAGPKDKRLTSVMPGKTQLLWVKMDKDTVKVNFDENICRSFRGGSTGEEMLVGSIVNTLTEFPEVKQVQILVEGHEVDSIGGHLDTSKPLKRMKKLLRK